MTEAEKIGVRIRMFREQKGLTQEELAQKCGRSDKSTVGKWESGTASPPAALLPVVAAALEVSVGELFGEAA